MGVTRQHHLDFQRALGHHPGQHFQPLAQQCVLGVGEAFQQPCRDAFLQIVALADGLDVPFIEGAPTSRRMCPPFWISRATPAAATASADELKKPALRS